MSGFADGWVHGRPETACGSGSTLANTAAIRAVLPKWLTKYEIKTLADAGAGDMNWVNQMQLPCQYVAYDVYQRTPGVIAWDITKDPLPYADAILCRHVLNHMNEQEAKDAVRLMRRSCRYLIANTMKGLYRKLGAVGYFTDYDLADEPFSLGEPIESVDDCRGQLSMWQWH